MNAYTILFALVLIVPANALASATTDFKVFASGIVNITHELQLKAIQQEDGDIRPVSDFTIEPENVVQIKQGGTISIFTSDNEPERIEKVKVTDSVGMVSKVKHLGFPRQEYSKDNLSVGVYLLDIIVDAPDSSDKNA